MGKLQLALALCLLASVSFAAGSANILVLPNIPAVLTAGNSSVVAIIYSPASDGADAAFLSHTTLVEHGAGLPSGDLLGVVFDADGLRQIKAGGKPDRSGWAQFQLNNHTPFKFTQTVYSSPEGYEANFEPSIPPEAAGRRVWVEYANDYWLIGDMDAQSRRVLLYREGAYGRINASRNLSYGDYLLSFLSYDGEKVLVRFQGGLEPTYFSAQQFNDPSSKLLTVWADYNSSQGPLENADCYLEGDVRGPLSLINNRYKGQLDYSTMPDRFYSYAVSCSKEGYEPKALVLEFNATPPLPAAAPAPAAPQASQPTQIGASPTPYKPPADQPTLLQMLDRLIKDPFWWLRGK